MDTEIEKLTAEQKELQEKLAVVSVSGDAEKIKEFSIALADVEKRISSITALNNIERAIKESAALLLDGDPEIRRMAEAELVRLRKEKAALTARVEGSTLGETPSSVIMEIRAGAGGDEAALFARNLFEMYRGFAAKKGWKTVLISASSSDIGGYKEVIFEIAGADAYALLIYESGVHRVQRIPETEKTGRLHTSTASVAVLPKAREVDVEIKPQDIKIEFFRSSGPGGQNVNKVETAVRIYHLPTGLIIVAQEERSQQQNRERAMSVLRSKILDAKRRAEEEKMAAARKEQIGTQDRSEKIRTYNFPQDRITDHRIKQSWHNIRFIMEGNLDEVVGAVMAEGRVKSKEKLCFSL
ncbi:MAG: peptide chain release factor 1 [Patescibacteria group bacterium]